MSTAMDELAAFLTARLDEVEAHHRPFAEAATPPYDQPHRRWLAAVDGMRTVLAYYTHAAQEQARAEARIREAPPGPAYVAALNDAQAWRSLADDRRRAVAAVAYTWSDHPDYRQEYRP